MKRILQNNCKFLEKKTDFEKVLRRLFIQPVNKTYCNEIGMETIKNVSFCSFRFMIKISILGGGVVNRFRLGGINQ